MKLQLDKKNLACMVLTPSGPVSVADAQILRVGFRKLLGTARTTFLIDASKAEIEPEAEHLVLETQIDALANKIRLVIIGPNPRVCQAPNLKAAQTIMSSVIQLDRVLVPQLQTLYKRLRARREVAVAHLENPDPASQPAFVTAENARLLSEVGNLEEEVEALLKVHVVPEPNPGLAAKRSELENRLNSNLSARRIGINDPLSDPGLYSSEPASMAPASASSFAFIAKRSEPKELSQGELKAELQGIEAEVVELEKRVRRLFALKAENHDLKLRIKKLRRVLYALLHYAMHPTSTANLERKLRILAADLEELASKNAKAALQGQE